MELQDAVKLIRPALLQPQTGQLWADLGSGEGLFTRALATILTGSTIHAVDRSSVRIEPFLNGNNIVFHQLDFSESILPFAQLDGILMANSMHFVQDKRQLLSKLGKLLRHGGHLLIIEYELDKGNQWIPYPIPYASLKALLVESGFTKARLIGTRPSIYGGRRIYASAAAKG